MAFTDRIKVDLYGQYNNNTEHAYSYPDKITNQYSFTEATQWAAAITDPRALFQSVCKTGPCYMIYRHKNGYYYSYVERNASDSRSGLEMITIFVPNGVRAIGYTVLGVLKDLRALLIGSRRYDDMLVKNCISRISESNSKELFPVKSQQNPTGQSIAAFRTYKDESELSELFTFLKQAEYANIDKLLLVKSTDVKEGTSLQHISQPIKRIFTVVPSTNVRADKSEVAIGDSFHITYTKEDYYVTHRIVEKNGNKVITKGDANNVADEEISVSNIVGKVIYYGGILNFFIDFKYIIAGGLLCLYLLSIFFEKKNNKQE